MTQCRCPECGAEITVETVAKAPDETRVTFVLHPMPGELIQAGTVGGQLAALGDLMRAAGKHAGARTETFIEGMSSEDGALRFSLRVLNLKEVTA